MAPKKEPREVTNKPKFRVETRRYTEHWNDDKIHENSQDVISSIPLGDMKFVDFMGLCREFHDRKIMLIKVLREITGMDLRSAKLCVDNILQYIDKNPEVVRTVEECEKSRNWEPQADRLATSEKEVTTTDLHFGAEK